MQRRRGIEDETERAKRPKPTQSAEKRTDMGDWAKSLFEKGAIPATELVKGARAEKASSSASGASSLSERLSRGKRPADHASRDVMRALNKNISLPEPYTFQTQFWDPKTGEPFQGDVSFTPMHEVITEVVDAPVPSEHCTWEASQSTLDADLSAACRRVNTSRTSRTVALSLWGDFAQYHTRDSICLLLWNSLSGRDHRRFWAIAFIKRYMC